MNQADIFEDQINDLSQKSKHAEKCPHCGQTVKVYRRRIYAAMVKALASLYRAVDGKPDKYVHVSKIYDKTTCGDFAKLKYWGLIDELDKVDGATRTSGFWRITERGIDFLQGKIRVAKYAFIYNQDLLALDDKETVSVIECVAKHFNYAELMAR